MTLWAFLVPTVSVLGQVAPPAEAPEVVLHEANFQPYVFWAYGLVCALIFAFTLWTAKQSRGLDERIRNLEERLHQVQPES